MKKKIAFDNMRIRKTTAALLRKLALENKRTISGQAEVIVEAAFKSAHPEAEKK